MSTKVQEHKAHATLGTYLTVAAILTVITLAEFGVVYVAALKGVVIPILIVLSAAKFWMVASFFMHLKFDAKLFTVFFVTGILLAIAVTIAVARLAFV